jgi:hypothetical protein
MKKITNRLNLVTGMSEYNAKLDENSEETA